MRSSTLLLTLLVVSLSAPARAQAPSRGRGALTVVGVGLGAASLVLGGLGAGALLNASAWDTLYLPYDSKRGATAEQAPKQNGEDVTVAQFINNAKQEQSRGIAFLIAGGASLALGVVALLVDGLLASQSVSAALVPTGQGLNAVFGLRF